MCEVKYTINNEEFNQPIYYTHKILNGCAHIDRGYIQLYTISYMYRFTSNLIHVITY